MNPEEEFNRGVWLLLQEIKRKMLRERKETEIEFQLKPGMEKHDQLSIIGKLRNWNILEDDDWVFEKNPVDGTTVNKVILTINQPEFDRLYDKLKYEFSPKIQIIEREIIREKPSKEKIFNDKMIDTIKDFKKDLHAVKQDGVNKILLSLSPDGDLYRKPKSKHCYTAKKTGLSHKIIRFLLNHENREDYIPGKDIAEAVGASHKTVANTINRIRSIANYQLNLPENEPLILSRDRGGYKLNPLFPIEQE